MPSGTRNRLKNREGGNNGPPSNRLYFMLLLVAGIGIFQTCLIHMASEETMFLTDAKETQMKVPPPTVKDRGESSPSLRNGIEKETSNTDTTNPLKREDIIENDDLIRSLLEKAGDTVTMDTLRSIPRRRDFTSLYGSSPIILGLEKCETYRNLIPPERRRIGPAGMFNTGTNLLAQLLSKNCALPKAGRGNMWQVPWGKHSPVSYRLHNVAQAGGMGVVQTDVLPVVTVKDPYTWMASMCRHSYAANWKHVQDHCPNLIPNDLDITRFKDTYNKDPKLKEKGVPVRIRFKPTNFTEHTSLGGLWNDWYGAYERVSDFPRLIIRFEDYLLHPEAVIKSVCECAGGTLVSEVDGVSSRKRPFSIIAESAKGSKGPHTGAIGLISALKKYGNADIRRGEFTSADLEYAAKHLDRELMNMLGYGVIL